MSVSRSLVSAFTFAPPACSFAQSSRAATTPAGRCAFSIAVNSIAPRSLKTRTRSPSPNSARLRVFGMHFEMLVGPRLHLPVPRQIRKCRVHVVVVLAGQQFKRIVFRRLTPARLNRRNKARKRIETRRGQRLREKLDLAGRRRNRSLKCTAETAALRDWNESPAAHVLRVPAPPP